MMNVFLDIDGTITDDIDESNREAQKEKHLIINHLSFHQKYFITVMGRSYFLYPGAVELIKLLTEIEDVNLTYFSLGLETRNHKLITIVHEIVQGFDPHYNIPVILSQKHSDVTVFQATPDLELKCYAKDISKYVKENELADSILIDDQPKISPDRLVDHQMFIAPERFSMKEVSKLSYIQDNDYRVTSEFEANNKMFFIAGMFCAAYANSKEQGQTLSGALKSLQQALHHPQEGEKSSALRLSYYERGLTALKVYNPTLQLIMPSTINLNQNIVTQFHKFKHKEGKDIPGLALTLKEGGGLTPIINQNSTATMR
jgi:hypothetical protein